MRATSSRSSAATRRTRATLLVEYQPSVEGEPVEEAFLARLAERRADELIRRTTLVGPHRDDLGLAVQGLVARGFASHGEGWGAALCLRLALAGAVGEEAGEPPLTLLDDPFSALDPERRARLAGSLDGRGQLMIAVPDDAQIPPRRDRLAREGGACRRVTRHPEGARRAHLRRRSCRPSWTGCWATGSSGRGGRSGELGRSWASVVGERLAEESAPVSLDDQGALLVRASTAAWAAQVRFLAEEIVAAANRLLGDDRVTSVRVVVGRQTGRKDESGGAENW